VPVCAAMGRGSRCLGNRPERLRDSTADACVRTCALRLQSRDIALADRVRYHVNVYWENAPDHRASRTPDWLNDACEARLKEQDRDHGKVTYAALMSPVSIAFTFPSFNWKRPFTQANLVKLRLGKTQYNGVPISLLVTTKPNKTDADRTTPEIGPYVLLGMKKRLGRRASVKKYKRADICNAKPVTDDFQCKICISTFAMNVGFATKFEVDVLLKCLNLESEPESKTAAAKSDS
jgi:hypothetical protein